MENGVTGLYGCSCHPFKDWSEHNKFNNQKLIVGEKYKIRHSEIECIIKGVSSDNPGFVNVFVEPYDCERCNQMEHKSNLIPVNNYQLTLF